MAMEKQRRLTEAYARRAALNDARTIDAQYATYFYFCLLFHFLLASS
jgi:hypothetical protein